MAFRRAKDNDPDLDEAKFAFDSLACPLKGVVRSSYAIEMQPAVSAAYRTMLRRIRTVLPKGGKVAAISGLCCLLFDLFVARFLFPGAYWGGLPAVRRLGRQYSRLRRCPDLHVQPNLAARRATVLHAPVEPIPRVLSNAVTSMYVAAIVGFFLICIMIGIG